MSATQLELRPYWHRISVNSWRGFRKYPWIPGLVLVFLLATAIFAPVLTSYNPRVGELSDLVKPPAWLEGGTSKHMLGTDGLGRDIWSRLVFGGRVSLAIAVTALAVGVTIGVTLGLISGYFGGIADEAIMRLVDMTLAVPLIFVALVVVVVFGQSVLLLVLILSLFTWNSFARQVRAETLQLKETGYVALAKVAGASDRRIMFRHILPGTISTVLVISTLRVPQLILTEAILSFLGAGVPPPTPSWGAMVSDGRAHISSAWWIAFWPGVAILLTVLSMNFIGDWMRDRFDPRLRQL